MPANVVALEVLPQVTKEPATGPATWRRCRVCKSSCNRHGQRGLLLSAWRLPRWDLSDAPLQVGDILAENDLTLRAEGTGHEQLVVINMFAIAAQPRDSDGRVAPTPCFVQGACAALRHHHVCPIEPLSKGFAGNESLTGEVSKGLSPGTALDEQFKVVAREQRTARLKQARERFAVAGRYEEPKMLPWHCTPSRPSASFLTKHLLLSYRQGEAHYMRYLTDGDWAQNNAGWQWSAGCGCDAQPYFRVFNPESQQKKFDPDGQYIRQWIPELDTLEYPSPIVDLKESRKACLERYSKALSATN